MWERPRVGPGEPHEKLGISPGEAQDKPSRRVLGDALQTEATEKPRGGPGEAHWEKLGRCLAEAQERPSRSREEARKSLGEVRIPSEAQNGLGHASQKPRRSPEAQGKPRKDPKEAREKLGTGSGQAPKKTRRLFGAIQAKPMKAPEKAREAQGLIFA